MINIIVLISGNGSNLQAIIDAQLNINIRAVISNKSNIKGLERAKNAQIPTQIIDSHHFDSREAFDNALKKHIEVYQPDLIVLAGFMQRLGAHFVSCYEGKIINIHPSLLPKYPGLHTHQKVLKNHDKEHGTSIHFVNKDLDKGPLIAQSKFTVSPDDTEECLKLRVQRQEHQLYPAVLALFADHRIVLKNSIVLLDGQPIDPCTVLIE